MKVKSIIIAAAVSVASAITLLTGCEPNESLLTTAANTAGNLGLSAWFAVDDPDAQVKAALKDVVTLVNGSATTIGEGGSYVDALTPVVQKVIADHDELTPAQKNLINAGSAVVLGALDTLIASYPEVQGNVTLTSKVVASFCRGCLTAIERSESSAAAKSLKKAHATMQMTYDAKVKAFVAK